MRLQWSPAAFERKQEIRERIATSDPGAAIRLDERFERRAELLLTAPSMGRPGLVEGTRETVVHRNYRLVYTVTDDVVTIVAIVHSAQQWPPVD